MNSLRGRVFLLLILTAVVMGVVCLGAVVVQRGEAAHQEAIDMALSTAQNAAAVAGMELGLLDDHRGASSRLANAYVRQDPQKAFALVGTRGDVLGATPSKPAKVDYDNDPDCAECHESEGSERPSAIVTTRSDGIDVARAFVPIIAQPVCAECHPVDGGHVGFIYYQIPVDTIYARHMDRTLVLLGVLIALGVVCGVVGMRVVRALVDEPIGRLGAFTKALVRGEEPESPEALPDELEKVARLALNNSQDARELVHNAHELCKAGLDMSERIGNTLAAISSNLGEDRDSSNHVEKVLVSLGNELEQVRAAMNLIGASADDNAKSLSELTNSVDRVASDADQLSGQVRRSVLSLQQMTKSVQFIDDQVELLGKRAELAMGNMEAIEQSANDILANATSSTELSGRMSSASVDGVKAVTEGVDGIKRSHNEILVAAGSMKELDDSSRSVGNILKIINEINDKTKLLALNAAIIAAQAGEHGRSFAVVAHEIKGLSDRTTSSTSEIARIIESIREGVERAISNVNRGEESLASSVERVEQTGELLSVINMTAVDAHDKLLQISELARRQSMLSKEVTKSVSEVNVTVDDVKKRMVEHSRAAVIVDEAGRAISTLAEQVKGAAKEQAETSRYLSEAFTIIDVHLKSVLSTLDHKDSFMSSARNDISELLARVNDSRDQLRDSVEAVGLLEGFIEELEALSDRLETRRR